MFNKIGRIFKLTDEKEEEDEKEKTSTAFEIPSIIDMTKKKFLTPNTH